MLRIFIPKFRSIYHLLLLLTICWLVTFIYYERYIPNSTVRKCHWEVPSHSPSRVETKSLRSSDSNHLRSSADSSNSLQTSADSSSITNVLVIADPQLIDNHTYPGRNPLLLKLSQHTVDVYLKRNYYALINNLRPNYVMFVGDYLDNGRSSSDEYFNSQWLRFKSIFYNKFKSRYVQNENWFINVPGNHDIGFGDKVKLPLRSRFTSHFGVPNSLQVINNVQFISLDALSYSSDDSSINSDSLKFIDSLPQKSTPRVLLTHVPLYRDDSTSCGPLRESAHFGYLAGYQYQTFIDPQRSNDLLTKLQPDLIFSGDDHDYCDIYHDKEKLTGREITVKSISMAMGIKYPAVQLLSFTNDKNGFNYNTQICYVQTPYINVAAYVVLAVVSGVLILWWNVKQRSSRYNYSILPMINTSSISLKSRSSTSSSTPSTATTSKKISNFLKDQDTNTNHNFNIPTYTSSSYASSPLVFSKIKQSRLGKLYYQSQNSLFKFVRRWNLVLFVKHSALYGLFVICLYYFGFCLTL